LSSRCSAAERAPARFWVDYEEPFACKLLAAILRYHFRLQGVNSRPAVLLCLGTDRLTGDALGPLVGTKVSAAHDRPYSVYGTLAEPVHALNLREKLQEIYRLYKNPFVVAVDASLGNHRNVGVISVGTGPVHPGTGLKKSLPRLGNLHIIGVVNQGGVKELQNTRLQVVMSQAEVIASALLHAAQEILSPKS